MRSAEKFQNPFRPGAGHMPPFLAGRDEEQKEFLNLLKQNPILQNLILTGLRGIGKTVLLEHLKPVAISNGWLWVGTDMSESTCVSEDSLAVRILTDLSVITSGVTVSMRSPQPSYFTGPAERTREVALNYMTLVQMYNDAPGLVSDKLKYILETAWTALSGVQKRGVIFAYDEAQNLTDQGAKEQYPLSLLLDVFQSLQRKNIPFMLVLAGLPTLFPRLVEARTFAERMFHIVFLKQLTQPDTALAIQKPINSRGLPFSFTEESVQSIYEVTHGYPYFIQYVCRECFDVWVQNYAADDEFSPIPRDEIMQKLDTDFFAGRWARVTDRQRELLSVIANLDGVDDGEFTVQEVVEKAGELLTNSFGASHVNQMLGTLSEKGLVFKNRHGRYLFAVPLMSQFIRRAMASAVKR